MSPPARLLATLAIALAAAFASAPPSTPPVPTPPVVTADASSGDTTITTSADGTQAVSYLLDDSTFANPERGWYTEVAPEDYGSLYAQGYTLVMRYVRLDSYRGRALPAGVLDQLGKDFAAARGTGVKLVLRFAYNRSHGPDAPIAMVLRQIEQLKPLLHEYADVIAVMQAGFIGAYGEWHDSTHDLTSAANRAAITHAILAALPTSRMVEIRTPAHAEDIFPAPVDAGNAFNGSEVARVGQHNDCFLSNGSDAGTYLSARDYAYAEQVTTYTAMGGETCDLGGLWSRNDCPTSIEQLATYHWDYLNTDYWTAIYDKWKKQGCYDEITRRLGYRFALTRVTAPTTLAPGHALDMTITLRNSGFGKLYNPRPLELVLEPVGGGRRVVVTVSSDVRRLLPLAGRTKTINVGASLPADTPAGAYDVYLRLPDASPHLSADPRYAIRLANRGTWVAADGTNDLHLQIAVE